MTLDYRGIILRRMQELGWTQARLAEVSGISEGTISNILGGRTKSPEFETAEALLNALGMELTVRDTALVERIEALADPDPDSDWKYGKNFGIMLAVREIRKGENDERIYR